jgi:hypothetical protein
VSAVSAIATVLPAGPDGDEVRDHACRLLRRFGLQVAQVVRVDVDSVLYVDRSGQPRTAWLCAGPSEVVVHDEPGFSAEQPAAA